ncbi:dimethyladenosine transferase 2, mitochondrial [Condylostylus longicornis]|uniref:dimethyladenosine transferase 2, mitochondrial n=1 Tax=Condylostylus longicornis TaxID=2530218 RepID=UPI00244E0BE3|nr:dimethyladenosine transferase 2, mitochondrial [Condylostylus longicornis]
MWCFRNRISCLENFAKYSTVSKTTNVLNSWVEDENLILPKNLSKKKHKYSDHIYINSDNGAQVIAKKLPDYISKNSVVLEVNPGNGFLTRHLLRNSKIKKLLLFETHSDFIPKLEALQAACRNRIEIKHGDFFNLWKLSFRDKMDNGTRLPKLLSNIPKTSFNDDCEVKICGGVGTKNFFKHLITSLTFNTSLFSYGRFEMLLIVPPSIYVHLTSCKESGYFYYRSTSVLFQIMFEYKFICKIPKFYFLPTLFDNSTTKKVKKKNVIDPEFLYLVKVVPRRNIYELCSLEDMPALCHFVKQTYFSRKNRVIPLMEKWAPGCGPRLILNSKGIKSVDNLFEEENEKDLPAFSRRCTTMSTEDYFSQMNIYTEFGELNPSQMLTLFLQFRNWPEYKESPFLASLESSLLKMEPSSEDIVDEVVVDDNITSKEFSSNVKAIDGS